ncbi:MarR family winged helix-turn-helix transcriptional regulator [Changpingibacter yushuensis]|uniref:MarR family winged helix-turn-helix transcriptional regulator n=1 Tax=Changpingibacter yushuensis TaxID=2758440 RepID=UPI001C712A7F|nr:MarR family winged helix-turn-helix transcriptional regulator [Changpingibacter yushuensis]
MGDLGNRAAPRNSQASAGEGAHEFDVKNAHSGEAENPRLGKAENAHSGEAENAHSVEAKSVNGVEAKSWPDRQKLDYLHPAATHHGHKHRGPESFDPETADLRSLMHHTSRTLRRTWIAQLEPWELTPFQWRALRTLSECDGDARPSAIADRLGITPRSATEVIDQLEAKGLVERSPDPKDRRATRVQLTEAGTATAHSILSEGTAHSEQYFAPLSPAEQAQLASLLRKLARTR